MDKNKKVAAFNKADYNALGEGDNNYFPPHIRHDSLRKLYAELLINLMEYAKAHTDAPRVLDLGAGNGSVTLPFLEMGAYVTAVDISHKQLSSLEEKCVAYADHLTLFCGDVADAVLTIEEPFDIVVMNSFIHHIPDYIPLVVKSVKLLHPGGQFFSFQDPMKFSSLGLVNLTFSKMAHYSSRIFGGDAIGGLKRYIRRRRGIYLEDSSHDNTEYHAVRDGVDEQKLVETLTAQGLSSVPGFYFSASIPFYQWLGEHLGIVNTFYLIARRPDNT